MLLQFFSNDADHSWRHLGLQLYSRTGRADGNLNSSTATSSSGKEHEPVGYEQSSRYRDDSVEGELFGCKIDRSELTLLLLLLDRASKGQGEPKIQRRSTHNIFPFSFTSG